MKTRITVQNYCKLFFSFTTTFFFYFHSSLCICSSNNLYGFIETSSKSIFSPKKVKCKLSESRDDNKDKQNKIYQAPIRDHSYGLIDLFPNYRSGDVFENEEDDLWKVMRKEAEEKAAREPLLVSFLWSTILNHNSLESSLAFHMANKLASPSIISTDVYKIFMTALEADESFRKSLRLDILAVRERDPACTSSIDALLYFKGFQAIQSHRVSHWLWTHQRQTLAHFLQSQVSEKFQIDIHPGAKIGSGLFIDHGHAIVVGETAVIGNNVSMLHQVTLGGSGVKGCARHPKIGDNVLIGAGASILGPIRIGNGAQIGACSLVVQDIPDHMIAVGVPAKILGPTKYGAPSLAMRHSSIVESDGAGI